ncbi:PRC and DUF2382 domain-containing protein [Glaciibacter superstes]|uniref:PRC and DUF2382 domain-containing protein n=1 Tax=Glaciibacter superstes TaxID=501023 RepID=UPI0003B79650|nr:PRC and DUF2382 domain-containing protein [Glaciibacter superstes]
MISTTNLGALMGAPVLGPDDEKIGTVGQIFVDPDDGHPNWMTVHTGLFGRHETFVPLDNATWDHERVHVDIDKDVIKGAPRIDVDAPLEPSAEAGLYRYYGLSDEDDGDRAGGGVREDTDARNHSDEQPISDSSVADERAVPDDDLAAGGAQEREVETGRVRLRKYVVTEQKTMTVPVAHEEVRLESEEVSTDTDPDADSSTHSRSGAADERPAGPRHAR